MHYHTDKTTHGTTIVQTSRQHQVDKVVKNKRNVLFVKENKTGSGVNH